MSRTTSYVIPGIVGCALFMQMLDSTVVATALPAMGEAFDATPVRMNVAITSYLLAVAMFVPLSGWAADRFGAKRVFAAAMVLFTLASVFCALAMSLPHLIAGRALQGVAGAMMVPVGRVILLRSVPKSELVQAMAFLSIPALIGPMVGPPVGGALVTYASWHWIFLINVPIGILGVFLVIKFIPKLDDDLTTAPLDWFGFLLTSASLVCIVFSFEALGHNSLPAVVSVALLAIGVLFGLGYWFYAKRAAYPLVDLTLMRIPTFSISTWGGNLCRFPVGATPFLLVMLLQVGFGMSALAAGLITFVGAVGSMLLKFVAAPILRNFGFRRTLVYNAWLTGISIAVCAFFTQDTPTWVILAVLLIGGFFRSLQLTSVNTLAYADLPSEKMSRASSLSSMAQQVGISLGVGIAAVSLNLSMMARGSDTLIPSDVGIGFVVIGALVALSTLSFRRLQPSAGAEVSGDKRGRRRAKAED